MLLFKYHPSCRLFVQGLHLSLELRYDKHLLKVLKVRHRDEIA